jgi:hypothetical protein
VGWVMLMMGAGEVMVSGLRGIRCRSERAWLCDEGHFELWLPCCLCEAWA